jgi:transcriptional regulator with XRE-family HTH domain
MLIGERIRSLREKKGLTQGDIEERSGLLRCYDQPEFLYQFE